MTNRSFGRVYLVGGGPGDPGLLTLRGRACLERAEAVVYDYLVNPRILEHAPQAELICLGRHGRGRILSQPEINARLVALAQDGRTVVRLKGGDPAIFGHLAEEVAALQAAGIEYEIVPGVTAASAAAGFAGIPLTQRDAASAVALIAGQEGSEKEQRLDYAALAAFPGTLVFYMGVTTARQWTAALIAAGKPGDTPVAAIVRASWPDQQTLPTTLAALADELARRKIRPPAVFIVGPAAALAGTLDWYGRRALSGTTVVSTRPSRAGDPLVTGLEELGAKVIVQPAIEIGPPPDWKAVDAAIRELHRYQWIVFSSGHGVESFLGRLLATGHDLRRLGDLRLAAIGPATAAALSQFHLRADLVPDEYRAEALLSRLTPGAQGQRFLLVRASRGRDVLAEGLRAAGADVDQAVTYTSRDVAQIKPQMRSLLAAGRIDWITVTSSAIARSLARLLGPDLGQARLASISPLTSGVLRELGWQPAVEASTYTMDGLVAAILAYRAGER